MKMGAANKAKINKSKAEMKLWRLTFKHYLNNTGSVASASLKANGAVYEFNKTYDEYGNAL